MGSLTDKPTTETMINNVAFIYSNTNRRFEAWDGAVTVASGASINVTITSASYTGDSFSSYTSNANPVSGDSSIVEFRNSGISNVAVTLKGSPGNLYGWSAVNPNNQINYVKVFAMPASNVIVGTTQAVKTIMVPSQGANFMEFNGISQLYATGLSVLATSTYNDLGTQVAPSGNQILFQAQYK